MSLPSVGDVKLINFNNDCTCDRRKNKMLEFFKISNSRTEIRCADCKGLIGWWDDKVETHKIIVPKRNWTPEELEELK